MLGERNERARILHLHRSSNRLRPTDEDEEGPRQWTFHGHHAGK